MNRHLNFFYKWLARNYSGEFTQYNNLLNIGDYRTDTEENDLKNLDRRLMEEAYEEFLHSR